MGPRSYRTKVRLLVLGLGLLAIGVTGWEASSGAAAAMRQATYDRLAAIRETRGRQIERYFADVSSHVLALSTDESTGAALVGLRSAWSQVAPADSLDTEQRVRRYYDNEYYTRVDPSLGAAAIADWYPKDPRVLTVQAQFLADNPHPVGAKDLLLDAPGAGAFGAVHARYHPTFHRYLSAFGFYDIFIVDATSRRVLYSVSKEIDFGVNLGEAPFAYSGLARAVDRALRLNEAETVVIEDYAPYPPSYFAPAAFLAAPIWEAGLKVGVLAIQVSVAEVNRVMAGERQWAVEGLGQTGQSYLVAADGTLRSDPRAHLEDAEAYVTALEQAGVGVARTAAIRRHGTAILNMVVAPDLASRVSGPRGTELGVNTQGVSVLRSHAPVTVAGLDWAVVAEIEATEALAPVRALQMRILGIGALVSLAFFATATWLARSVTTPVMALANGVRRLEQRDFGARVTVSGSDEIGELAQAFNRMAQRLEDTTVSKAELEVLAGRLITAQEDERRRLARELHDDITQRMAALSIEAGLLEQATVSEASASTRAGLARVRTQLAALSTDIHQLSRRLHPATLDDLGLVTAIEAEARAFFERGGPPVEVVVSGQFDDLGPGVGLALYRIVQESLHNVLKHAEAEQVRLDLRREDHDILLRVEDDGRGFSRTMSGWRHGLGLASMEERVRLLGGRLTVESLPGVGTTVEVRVPVAGADDSSGSERA
jgi:signal transduction histidine kinase